MAGNFNNQMGYNNPQFPYNNNNNNLIYDNNSNYMTQQYRVNNQFLKCRPVSSREEAMAFQIDLDGSLWVFPNVANGKIYTKQINNDGTASFGTYAFVQNENPYNSGQYVTKNEFNKVIQTIMAAIGSTNNGTKSAESNTENNSMKDIPMNF